MHDAICWFQLILYVGILLLITKPLGLYLLQVLDAKGKTWLDPLVRPVERLTYRLCGIDPEKEHHWKHYTISMLLFSVMADDGQPWQLPCKRRRTIPSFTSSNSTLPPWE